MKNLAGVRGADNYIQEELNAAGIDISRMEMRSAGEVPYSIKGKLGDWDFERAWYYWMASAPDGKGLPLEVASELHERKYPIIGENQPKNYGQVIRVAGHCGCPHPKEWAFPTDEVVETELKRLGKKDVNFGQLARLCDTGKIKAPRYVNNYHIDTQIGLNEFAKVLKSL